jgi:hypothetical protein
VNATGQTSAHGKTNPRSPSGRRPGATSTPSSLIFVEAMHTCIHAKLRVACDGKTQHHLYAASMGDGDAPSVSHDHDPAGPPNESARGPLKEALPLELLSPTQMSTNVGGKRPERPLEANLQLARTL